MSGITLMRLPTDTPHLKLHLLKGRFAICRLDAHEKPPSWARRGAEFTSITRTADELSVICAEDLAPKRVKRESGWRMFKIEGPLDFALTGILAAVAKPLADTGVSIFVMSTYDTDYLMVREENVEKAARALQAAGHAVECP
jgi:hypothetical protein